MFRCSGSRALGLAVSLCLAAGAARADDPPRAAAETAPARRTDSVTVITRQEIERRQWRTLADVLRAQAGIHVTQLGGRGQDTLLFFRGNPNGTVLLRMDGIDLSDPSSDPLGSINDPQARAAGQIVPDLLTENIERIEIVRGPLSARHGSDAIGGVIEIETRRGSGPLSPWAAFEAGGFGTTQQSAGFVGGSERSGYALAYSNVHTRGISATPLELGNHERDANDSDTLSGRIDFAPLDALSLRLAGRMIDEDSQLDDPFPIPLTLSAGSDPRSLSGRVDRRGLAGERRRLYLGAETSLALFQERWVQTFGIRYGDHDVSQDESERVRVPLIVGVGLLDRDVERFASTRRDGSRLSLDWRSDVRLSEAHTLAFGAETEREATDHTELNRQDSALFSFGSGFLLGDPLIPGFAPITLRTQTRERRHESLRNNAVFVADRFGYRDVFGELALRLHDHDEYGSGLTYRAGLGYTEPSSKLRVFAAMGTGFRDPDPSLAADRVLRFQNDFPSLGGDVRNVGLEEITIPGDRTLERAVGRGIELGVEAPLLDERLKLGATFFASRLRGLQSASTVLILDGGGAAQIASINDTADARTRGVEISAAWNATAWLDVSVDYTYTHAELAHVRSEPLRRFSDIIGIGQQQSSLGSGVTPSASAFAALTGLLDPAPSARAFATTVGGPFPFTGGPFAPVTPFRSTVIAPLLNASGTDVPGVPKHEIHASLALRPWEGIDLGFSVRYVGPRTGNRLGSGDRLGGYTLFDVTSSYAFDERFTLFARLENLFDKEYSDLELAGQPGFVGFVGLRAVF